jgi:peroxiredoxin
MEEVPLLKALHTKYADRGAVILGISIDGSVKNAEQTIKEKGMTWPVIADGKGFDGELPLKYNIDGTPTVFLLDRQGRIVARPSSARTAEEPLVKALEQP